MVLDKPKFDLGKPDIHSHRCVHSQNPLSPINPCLRYMILCTRTSHMGASYSDHSCQYRTIRDTYRTIRIVSFEKSVVSLIRIVGAYESDDTVICIVRIVRIVCIGCIGRYINN